MLTRLKTLRIEIKEFYQYFCGGLLHVLSNYITLFTFFKKKTVTISSKSFRN